MTKRRRTKMSSLEKYIRDKNLLGILDFLIRKKSPPLKTTPR